MITEERLNCFISGVDLENITVQDEIDMATELLSLRSQKKALIEDGERLAKFATDTASHDWKEVVAMTYEGHKALEDIITQHTALLKSIESEQPKG